MVIVFESAVKQCCAGDAGNFRLFRLLLNIPVLVRYIEDWKALAKQLVFCYYQLFNLLKKAELCFSIGN